MTLPYPDSPEVTENIGASISRIKDNLEYLDGLIGSGNVKAIISTPSLVSKISTQAITGVGFKPKSMMVFANTYTQNNFSWGAATQYSTCTSIDCNCVIQSEQFSGTASNTRFARIYHDASTYVEGSVKSFDSDGATVNWSQNGSVAGGVGYIMYIFFG